jgi:hypothetical protein
MRPDVVVVATPGFDHDARFLAAPEPFKRQTLVAELAVEALISTVLPGLAGVVQCRVDMRFAEPIEDRVADELRAVVATQIPGRAAGAIESPIVSSKVSRYKSLVFHLAPNAAVLDRRRSLSGSEFP